MFSLQRHIATIIFCSCILLVSLPGQIHAQVLGTGSQAGTGSQRDSYAAACAVWLDGKFDADGNRKMWMEHYIVHIPLEGHPGDVNNPETFGTGRTFEGDDGGDGCNGRKYNYSEFVVYFNWWYYAAAIDRTWTEDDNQAFWDWYYSPHGTEDDPGYTSPHHCDYTQNCHGYAFGTNNFVNEPDALTGRSHFIGFHEESCFEEVDEIKDAKFAHDGDHTVKVTGDECDPEAGDGSIECVPTVTIGGEVEGCKIQVISSTSEQFKESGTYTRSIVCPKGLDVRKAHREVKMLVPGWTDFDPHELIRRKTP